MRVNATCKQGLLQLHFHSDWNDLTIASGHATLAKPECHIQLPKNWSIQSVHPDVLALSISLIIYPFCGVNIRLPFGVSKPFHDTFKEVTKKNILPIDHHLKPRTAPPLSVPALAYSGGTDSTAALALLPDSTHLFFLDRIVPNNQTTKYNKEAAYYACEQLRKLGREVHMVRTDFEYVRNPVGYPVDVATAIPALLLSDYIGLDSIAFGTVMESAYRIGHITFMDYAERTHFKRWGTLFNAVHLPMNQVVAGISEVGTSIITMKSPYRKFAQSCIRGHAQNPCLNCMKCFRKVLLEKKIANQKMEDTFLAKLFLFKEVGSGITPFPIKHENVIAYITSQYEGKLPLMLLLRRKVRGDILHVAWMEKWYSPSLQLLPTPYRRHVQNEISQYLEAMTPSDEQNARSWNLTDVLSSEEYKEVSAEFQKALLRYIALNKKA